MTLENKNNQSSNSAPDPFEAIVGGIDHGTVAPPTIEEQKAMLKGVRKRHTSEQAYAGMLTQFVDSVDAAELDASTPELEMQKFVVGNDTRTTLNYKQRALDGSTLRVKIAVGEGNESLIPLSGFTSAQVALAIRQMADIDGLHAQGFLPDVVPGTYTVRPPQVVRDLGQTAQLPLMGNS